MTGRGGRDCLVLLHSGPTHNPSPPHTPPYFLQWKVRFSVIGPTHQKIKLEVSKLTTSFQLMGLAVPNMEGDCNILVQISSHPFLCDFQQKQRFTHEKQGRQAAQKISLSVKYHLL